MEPRGRRKAIIRALQASKDPISGNQLAARFGVTRAVIVQDVAVLRAGEHPITATPQGYVYGGGEEGGPVHTTQIAVRHGPDREAIAAELNAIVDQGATIRDVVVEHPLYGELRGLLMLKSRHDVGRFCRRLARSGAAPLLTLTGGVHLHTLEAPDPVVFQRVRRALAALKILLEDDE